VPGEAKKAAMHNFLAGLVFAAMVMTPFLVALTTKLDHKPK
jgi:hypothetical protein